MPNDTATSTGTSAAGASLAATWPGLGQLQQLIHETKVGLLALDSLISTPAAAMATGSPPASAAIVALGVELAVFLYETGQAMEHDVQALRTTARNYQANEADVAAAASAVLTALTSSTSSSSSSSTAGTQPGSRSKAPTPPTRTRIATATGGVR